MFSTVIFYILAFVLIVAAVRVILSRSPVTAVLNLILTFFSAAMLWILIGAEYLGMILVIVYIGAVMVLFLFVVMMIDVVPESLRHGFRTYLPLGIVVGVVMVAEIIFVYFSADLGNAAPAALSMPKDYSSALEIGKLMYSQYFYPIQIGALILLVGMIAAIAITLRKKSNARYINPADQVLVHATDRVRLVNMPSGTEQPAPATTEEGGAQS